MSHGGLHLFLGSDRPRKLQRLQELERSLKIQPLDRHQLDGATLTGVELIALCRQRPAASPVRLIVVDQAHRLDSACVEALRQCAEVIAANACLILFVEVELSFRHPLMQAGARPGENNEGRPPRQEQQADRGAGEVFIIERFPGRDTPAVKPFALTDALGNRDTAGALAAVHNQLLAGKGPLELLGLVAWQLNRWVLVRRLLDAGYGADRIAAVAGLRLWQVQRLQSEVAGRPLALLQGTLERCWQLDVDAKSGRHPPELAIEQLVAEVCLPGR